MKKNNIIPFPKKFKPQTKHKSYDNFDDIEAWEADYEMLERKEYKELLAYRIKKAEKRPDEPYIQGAVGDAFILNKEYKKAIDYLSKVHKKWPDFPDAQHSILEALYAQGLCENDFPWICKPEIIKLSKIVLDHCYDYLKPKRKPRSLSELYNIFLIESYVAFSEEELFSAIIEDDRFLIENSYDSFTVKIRVVRKKDSKNNIL